MGWFRRKKQSAAKILPAAMAAASARRPAYRRPPRQRQPMGLGIGGAPGLSAGDFMISNYQSYYTWSMGPPNQNTGASAVAGTIPGTVASTSTTVTFPTASGTSVGQIAQPLGQMPPPLTATGIPPDKSGPLFPTADCPCATIGHHVTPDVLYADGVVVGACKRCGDRVEIDKIPGNQPAVQARALTDMIVAGPTSPQLLAALVEMRQILEEDRREVELALSMLRTAEAKAMRDLAGE